jgi:hypothetical protein
MEGEDVKKLQKLLNLVNLAYNFSKTFPNGINENGKFTTFFTLVFYHEWLKWGGDKVKHNYEKDDHEALILDANLGMKSQLGDWGTEWVTG